MRAQTPHDPEEFGSRPELPSGDAPSAPSTPQRLIIRGPAEFHAEAFARLAEESIPYKFATYDKVGWGWSFGSSRGPRFFVRRIKDGLSCSVGMPK